MSKVARLSMLSPAGCKFRSQLYDSNRGCPDAKQLQPGGVAVVIEAEASCMMMRGVGDRNSVMKTSVFSIVKDDAGRRSFFTAGLTSCRRHALPVSKRIAISAFAPCFRKPLLLRNRDRFGSESEAVWQWKTRHCLVGFRQHDPHGCHDT